MGATLRQIKHQVGDGSVWGKVSKAPSPKGQGVTSTECQGTTAARRQAYVHRQARSLCSCEKEGMWEGIWGVKAGGGVLSWASRQLAWLRGSS